jgi:hypothetical protein
VFVDAGLRACERIEELEKEWHVGLLLSSHERKTKIPI